VLELASPRSMTSSRSSYGLPSPFSAGGNSGGTVTNYQPQSSLKPASAAMVAGSVDMASPSSSVAAAASQPLLSPLSSGTARDETSKQHGSNNTAELR